MMDLLFAMHDLLGSVSLRPGSAFGVFMYAVAVGCAVVLYALFGIVPNLVVKRAGRNSRPPLKTYLRIPVQRDDS